MDLRGDDFKRTARAPAKLNLFLEVLGRRADGFHDLETLMIPIRLADQVTFQPASPESDSSRGPIRLTVRTCWPARSLPMMSEVPTGRDNLIVKALELLRERSGCELGAQVDLIKRIPMAAGMGGGSSDASAALRLANCGWGINWSNDQLAELAAEIGSDVPFFLSHGAAVCRGRGERVEKLAARPRLHFVVVKPPVGLNTADVYRAYDRMVETSAESPPRKLGPLDLGSDAFGWRAAGRWMHNRLQAAAASLSPWVKRIQQIFAEFDFAAHQLTGSGSAYFGVCRHAQHARRLANILRARQLGLVYTTCSCQ